MSKLRQLFKARFDEWMRRRIKPSANAVLNSRIIYVLPSRNGLLYLLSTLLIFIAAINYAVSLAFGLAFMMASIFVLAILYTFNNLNQLSLKRLPAKPVFCGESVAFNIELSRKPDRSHESLELRFGDGVSSNADLVDVDRSDVQVFAEASKRGYFSAPLLRVTSFFPLGLCRAWSIINLDMQCLVYPKPVAFAMENFNSGGGGSEETALLREGSEDFYGLRDYVPGDSLKQVAWKNVARGQGMHIKQFVDYVDSTLWLDWDMFFGFDTEGRLSRLCYCVLQLAKSGAPFGLKLPGVEIPPGIGVSHRDKLLRELALYQTTPLES